MSVTFYHYHAQFTVCPNAGTVDTGLFLLSPANSVAVGKGGLQRITFPVPPCIYRDVTGVV